MPLDKFSNEYYTLNIEFHNLSTTIQKIGLNL